MPETPTNTLEACQAQPDSTVIAPVWHTAGLLLILGLITLVMSMLGVHRMGQAETRMTGYLITMTIEWAMVAYIALGVRWKGPSLRTVTGRNSPTWRSVALDLGLAAVFLFVANIVLGVVGFTLARFIRATPDAAIRNLLPHTGLEIATWLLLSLTAGICEEMIFRGYLQRQFTAWTGNAAAGIALQGIVFGVAHAYQGPKQILIIAVYGCMFGSLAWWRKSLRPGMAAHFFQDGLGGLMLAKFAR